MNYWLSAEDVAKNIKVPAMTIKHYCQIYKDFLKFQQVEKGKYLIHEECLPVFQCIAKARSKKQFQTKQDMMKLLCKEGFPTYIDGELIQTSTRAREQIQVGKVTSVQDITERVSGFVTQQEENIKEWLMEQQTQQNEFQKAVLQRLEEKDQLFLQHIREIQKTKKLLAVSRPQKQWWEFWK